MIPSFHYLNDSLQHTVPGMVVEGYTAVANTLQYIVNNIALDIILDIFISVPLLLLHHNLWAVGFVIGFRFNDQVQEMANRVNQFFNAYQTTLQRVMLLVGGGFLCLLMMPTSLAISSLYFSAKWGAFMYETSLPYNPAPNLLPVIPLNPPTPQIVVDDDDDLDA